MSRSSQQGPDRRTYRRAFVVLGVLCLGLFGAVTVYLLRDKSLGTPADDALRAAAASTTPQMMADGWCSIGATSHVRRLAHPDTKTYAQGATHGDIHGHAHAPHPLAPRDLRRDPRHHPPLLLRLHLQRHLRRPPAPRIGW